MSDLVAWLNARLDEDEAEANLLLADGVPIFASMAHTPARVLREVEAKRRIIAAYEDAAIDSPTAIGDEPAWFEGVEYALHALAAVYSDHPDYRSARA